jgi:hypothetical protein
MSTERLRPNFYLTEEKFKTLVGPGDWRINEIPLDLAAEIKDHFGTDTSFCLLTSGTALVPDTPNDNLAVAGIDWIRQEDRLRPGEKPLNVYHYVIMQRTDKGHPVFYLGKKDTVAPHWSELEDLKVYFKDWK